MDTSAVRETLLAERRRLTTHLADLGATENGELTGEMEFGDGFADAAAATAERTEVLGLVENLHAMLIDVDGALAKLDEGTYGTCTSCGNPIGADRLEFRPTSQLCVECKTKRR